MGAIDGLSSTQVDMSAASERCASHHKWTTAEGGGPKKNGARPSYLCVCVCV